MKKKTIKAWIIYASVRRGTPKKIIGLFLNKSVAEGENGYGTKAIIPCTIIYELPPNQETK